MEELKRRVVSAEVLDLISISLATIMTNFCAPMRLQKLVSSVAVVVVLDMVHECFEVFGIELCAHGVGHLGEDVISTSTGAREVFPADGSELFNLVIHNPVTIFLGETLLSVPNGIVIKAH